MERLKMVLASAAGLALASCEANSAASAGQGSQAESEWHKAEAGLGKQRQARPDLYACDGCEGVYGQDPGSMSWQAVMAAPDEPGERLILRGVVYQVDGITPARDVVVYAHQTNAQGLYAGGAPELDWSRRHGRIRAWIRTGADGRYAFRTIKPAPYPNGTNPAHIHLMVLEPDLRPYYLDEVVFAGEYRVDAEYRRTRQNRGGSGIARLARTSDGTWLAERDIILEPHPQ